MEANDKHYQNEATELETSAPTHSTTAQQKKGTNTWRNVAIGGVTGVMFGGGSVYAANTYTAMKEEMDDLSATNEAEQGLPMADVSGEGSLDEAFASARAEVGAGGLFVWNGTVYNTFTATEWTTMSEAEQAAFNDQMVHAVGSSDDAQADVEQPASEAAAAVESNAPVADVSDEMSFGEAFAAAREEVGAGGVFVWNGGIYGTYYADEWAAMSEAEQAAFNNQVDYSLLNESNSNTMAQNNTTTAEPSTADGNDEVQVLGFSEIENEDGSTATVGVLGVEGQEVYIVDANQDGTFETVIADANRDGEITANEAANIENEGLTVQALEEQMLQQTDPLLAEGPDYTNDADVHEYMA